MRLNHQVTQFLDELDHPFRMEIEALRTTILQADDSLSETIKWNGPNYSLYGEDRITMRINPPKQVQLVFHRGVKVQESPPEKLITDEGGLLMWKGNDRAIANFKNMDSINNQKDALTKLVQDWLAVTSYIAER